MKSITISSNTRDFTLIRSNDEITLVVKQDGEELFNQSSVQARVIYLMLDEWYSDRKVTKKLRRWLMENL